MREEIQQVLDSPDWTAAEKAVIRWQYNLYGSFYTTLFEAMGHADPDNLAKLEIVYPTEVAGYRSFVHDPTSALANKIDEALGL